MKFELGAHTPLGLSLPYCHDNVHHFSRTLVIEHLIYRQWLQKFVHYVSYVRLSVIQSLGF